MKLTGSPSSTPTRRRARIMSKKICLDAGHVGSKYNQSPVVKTYYESAMVWALHL